MGGLLWNLAGAQRPFRRGTLSCAPGHKARALRPSGKSHEARTACSALLSPFFYEKAQRIFQPFDCLARFRVFALRPALPLAFGSMRVSAAGKCGVPPALPLPPPVRQRIIGNSQLLGGVSHAHVIGQAYRFFLNCLS